MAKPAITKYGVKGSPLTTSELDTNFQNLTDATVTLTAGSGGTAVTSDLNGTITLVAGSNITLTGNNTAKTITITSSGGGGTVTNPLTANLDVGTYSIISASATDRNIMIIPDGTGRVGLQASTIEIGKQNTNVQITTWGTGDLRLNTNAGTGANTGEIRIYDGSNGNITIDTHGSGSIFLSPDTGNVVSESTTTYFGKADTSATIALNTSTTSPSKTLKIRPVSGSATVGIDLVSDGSMQIYSSTGVDLTESTLKSFYMTSVGHSHTSLADQSGTFTPSTQNGTVQEFTLSGSITINAFASPASSSPDYKKYVILIIKQPSTGGPYTLTSTMKFEGGSKTLSTAANAVDILEIFHTGSQYYATLRKGFA